MNIQYLKSPVLFGAALNFALGNFIVSLSVALWNDVLIFKIPKLNNESISYTEYYKVIQSNIKMNFMLCLDFLYLQVVVLYESNSLKRQK